MNTWIALLRGINVGGRNSLPMQDLKQLLVELGCKKVSTYIQSGNVVFQHAAEDPKQLAVLISKAIQSQHDFSPAVIVLSEAQLQQAAAANPFVDAEAAPTSLHLFFLDTAPEKGPESLDHLRADSESVLLTDEVLYLHAPDGVGRSKLVKRVEKALGVDATARNWRTVTELLELTRQSSSSTVG